MHTSFVRGQRALALALLAASAVTTLTGSAHAALVYGVTEQDVLLSWDSATPGTIANGVAITGLAQNETIQGIDFRPAGGAMFALGSQNRLYTINQTTGVATLVGAGPFSPGLNGSNFGFDFNPTVDRIRVVSNADQNFRLHPDTGAVAGSDTNLAYIAGDTNFGDNPNVTHAAYTNNFAGATTTTLYGIDTGLDVLVRQGGVDGSPSPNLGELTTIGSLGINVAEDGGFDIFSPVGGGNTAYAALRPTGESVSYFYTISLTTGTATLVGEIGGGVNIRAMTVVIPGPGGLAVLAAGLLLGKRRRRN
jgi:hypothetical protein